MTKRLMRCASVVLTTMFCTPSWAEGPFGIEIGSSIVSLKGCTPVDGNPAYHKCSSLPKSHSAFETYIVMHTTAQGVCWIKAIGKNISDSGYGISTRSQVETIAEQIATRYGASTSKMDFILPGALWDEPNEWLSALRHKERMFNVVWSTEEGFRSDNRTGDIWVSANGLSRDVGYVSVEFYGDNHAACEAELASKESDAF